MTCCRSSLDVIPWIPPLRRPAAPRATYARPASRISHAPETPEHQRTPPACRGPSAMVDLWSYRASTLTYTVPTAAERQGNLSDLLAYGAAYQIYDPKTTRPAASGRYTRDPFPGNLIPSSRLDATAQNLISRFYPLPNIPGAKPTGVNYTMPSLQANRFENQMLRIDRAFGEKHRLYVRGNMSDRAQDLERRF